MHTHPCANSYGSFLAMRSVCEPFESSRVPASPCERGKGSDGNGRIEGWNADSARLSSLESTSVPLLASLPLPHLLLFPLSLLYPYYYDSPFPHPRSLASTLPHPLAMSFVPLVPWSCLSCPLYVPIYLVLRFTLGLLEYRSKRISTGSWFGLYWIQKCLFDIMTTHSIGSIDDLLYAYFSLM